MAEAEDFVDYYRILQVAPTCTARSLENAYHALAKRYHPDHSDAPDVGRLTEVIDAYKALNDETRRAAYDALYARVTGYDFSSRGETDGQTREALSDAEAHARILTYLYKQRRLSAREPGVGQFTVNEMLGCSEDLFDFHLWYLREKGWIETTEQGTLAITLAGVDHVIAMSRSAVQEQRLIGQSEDLRTARD